MTLKPPRRQPGSGKSSAQLKSEIIWLPPALLLLGVHVVSLARGSTDRLALPSQDVFTMSLMLIGFSVLLLVLVAGRPSSPDSGPQRASDPDAYSQMRVAAVSALAVGLAGDFFVVAERLTRSTGVGIGAAALVLFAWCCLWVLAPVVAGPVEPPCSSPPPGGGQSDCGGRAERGP